MDKIAILDYGSQVTHLLATEVRRLNVYSEIVDSDSKAADLKSYKGIILSGGPYSVYEEGAPQVDPQIFDLGIPILGICYGHQLIVQHFKGEVASAEKGEYGKAYIKVVKSDGILSSFNPNDETQVWMSHRDTALSLPPEFEVLAETEDCPYAVLQNNEKKVYSIQFHLEVTHTERGREMLDNFLKITGASRDWTLENFLNTKIEEIRQEAADKNVFLLVSGGVDSTVAFALLEKAIGADRVYGLFVDTGFMRKNEVLEVETALKSIGITDLHVYNGKKRYIEALKGVHEPEKKRKIIGDLFLDIQDEVSKELQLNEDDWLLGQGTIYPDTIESGGTRHADKIKTHHNRVQRIEKLIEQGKIIEPIKDLYKDEVRQLGELLGLPHEMVHRHPFPGPALAVRILCTGQEDQPIDQSELKQINDVSADYNLKAHILPIQSVGVQGDSRTYKNACLLTGVYPGFALIAKLSTQLTNQFRTINRVLFAFKPTEISEVKLLKEKYLTEDRISLLQEADIKFTEILKSSQNYEKIWQSPVVLLPVSTNDSNEESLVLRPISSKEAMTADVYPLIDTVINDYIQKIGQLPLSGLFFDFTNKPPATIEWE